MLSDTLIITLNNASTRQHTLPLKTSAEQQITIFLDTITSPVKLQPSQNYSEAYQTMLALEDILRKDWDQPEEDAAWADL